MKTVYQTITAQIIENLEKAGSWNQLWRVPTPVNLLGHAYRGINHLLLSDSKYSSPVWGTFHQIHTHNGVVKKNERSNLVVFWKQLNKRPTRQEDDADYQKPSFLLRYYGVFNSEQCSFSPEASRRIEMLSGANLNPHKGTLSEPRQIVHSMPDRPKISHVVGQGPCYIPSLDEVRIPDIKYFQNAQAYYAALFHELVHSTGHRKRLNRFEAGQFSNQESYSKEELVAELGAAFLLVQANVECDISNTQAYLKSWLKALKDNPSWILWAAGKAQKACEYILSQDNTNPSDDLQTININTDELVFHQ